MNIEREKILSGMSYGQYCDRVRAELANGRSTGHVQTEEHLVFSKLNLQRMRRLDKTIVIQPALAEAVKELSDRYYLLILAEGWCGDAAQILPVFAALEKECDSFEIRIFLRDDHEELMQQCLTNGARAIPKVICIDEKTLLVRWTWGPRPAVLQEQVQGLISRKVSKQEKGLFVQGWYNADKTQTLQRELLNLVRSL